VVVLDIRLPNGSGLDVLKKIRPIRSDLNIIIFTAYPSSQHELLARKLGANSFLAKEDGFEKMEDVLLGLAKQHAGGSVPSKG